MHPPARFAMAPLDEHALTGHDRAWRSDLDAVRDLGATALRRRRLPRVHLGPAASTGRSSTSACRTPAAVGVTVIRRPGALRHTDVARRLVRRPAVHRRRGRVRGGLRPRYAGVVDHSPPPPPSTNRSRRPRRRAAGRVAPGPHRLGRVDPGVLASSTASSGPSRRPGGEPARRVIVHVEASTLVRPVDGGTAVVAEAALLELLGNRPDRPGARTGHGGAPAHDWLLGHGATPTALRALVEARSPSTCSA